MKRRAVIHRLGALGMLLARPLRAEPARIVIGQSAALSGPAKALGEDFRRGALLYFANVNARGGVAGRQLELRTLDDGYEPERCAVNTRRLIDEGATVLFDVQPSRRPPTSSGLMTSAMDVAASRWRQADALTDDIQWRRTFRRPLHPVVWLANVPGMDHGAAATIRCVPSSFCTPGELQVQRRSLRASGNCRTRLPVAAKMALHTAGATGGKAGSPKPVTG